MLQALVPPLSDLKAPKSSMQPVLPLLPQGEPLGLQSAACFSSLVLKSQVEPERHRIQTEFKQLRSILDREEQRELKKLEVEERKGLSIIEKAEGDLIHQSQSLKDLISDLEHRCQGSTVELLQVRLTDCKSPSPPRVAPGPS